MKFGDKSNFFFPARVNALASFRFGSLKITFLVTRSEGLRICDSPPPHAILFGCLNYTGVGKPN